MVKIKRIHAGFYSVGDRWFVEKNDDSGWIVRRFAEDSEELEEEYNFDYYSEARNHALMEAGITNLVNSF